jgi:hypothetical protein
MLRVLAVAAVSLLVLSAPAAASIVHATHKVSVKGELVNHWTAEAEDECDPMGDGTLTVKFETIQPARVWPFIDKFAASETPGYGSWIIGVPLPPHAVKDLRSIKASGTITRVDNTVPRPSADGEPCPPIEKQGCGTVPLRSHGGAARVAPQRYNKKRIAVDLYTDRFDYPRKPCGSGNLGSWSDFRFVGGDPESGVLRLTMPRARALKRRHTVRVTDSDHRHRGNDDVTRRATVTFKKL